MRLRVADVLDGAAELAEAVNAEIAAAPSAGTTVAATN